MKGVIVAAGYGTRFLPASKTIPKEMFPVIDRPAIDFIIDEFISSGIREILIVTSRRKKALEDYFDREIELEGIFAAQGAEKKQSKIKRADADFFFVRQEEMLGTGHALLKAKPFVGKEPFIVAYPDDLHLGKKPLSRQLVEVYEETGCSVLATVHDPPELHRYAVPKLDDDGVHVLDIVEKPDPGTELSREAVIGRILYSGEFLEACQEGWDVHRIEGSGEYHHIYGLKKLINKGKVVTKQIEGERVDIGTPQGYLSAILRYAMTRPELKVTLKRETELAMRTDSSSPQVES